MQSPCELRTTFGISVPFGTLSPTLRQITCALLTRSPLAPKCPFDLHVLSTPPAFVLSQDQTLQKTLSSADSNHLLRSKFLSSAHFVLHCSVFKEPRESSLLNIHPYIPLVNTQSKIFLKFFSPTRTVGVTTRFFHQKNFCGQRKVKRVVATNI